MRDVLDCNFEDTPELVRLGLQEELILSVTEEIARLMVEQGIRRSQLAQKLGRTKSSITQLLDGTSNMQIRTISDVLWALGAKLKVSAVPIASAAGDGASGPKFPEGIIEFAGEDDAHIQSQCEYQIPVPTKGHGHTSDVSEHPLGMAA